jgi:hypothetical protein
MRATVTLLALLAVGFLFASQADAQCCAAACMDADGDACADDLVSCGAPSVSPGSPPDVLPYVAGCEEVPGVACIGGRTRNPSLDPLKYPAAGCVCVGDRCVAGDPATGELLTDATAEQCTLGAAFFCRDGGNAFVEYSSAECTPCPS